MIEFENLRLFVIVAELGSFTAAGDKENYPKSTISRRIRKLEDQLRVRLLDRTTHTITLTESGQLFYDRAVRMLNDLEDTEQLLAGNEAHPVGNLRIGAPDGFLRLDIYKQLIQFAKDNPQLNIETVSGTVGLDLLGDRLDILIHIDDPEDSSFIARRITTATTNYYASPIYLSEHGEPQNPEDLLQHSCIVEKRNPRKNVNHWVFRNETGYRQLVINPRYSADTTYLSLSFTEEGLGIAMLPDHWCVDSLKSGRLVKLFNGAHEILHPLYAVYPSRRYVPAKVKTFLNFLQQALPDRL
jgi:DNA-binding transcriptional LysR family regulator